MRRKQFLLTTKEVGFLGGTTARVKAYNLFLGEDLNHTISVNHNVELHLLGVLHDWENPHLSNQENLDSIAQCDTIKEILSASDKYSGEFVIIVSINDDLYVFNDCCGQMEIYYDEAFSSFGTQPRLIGEVVDLIDHTDVSTIEYYQSQVFIKKCLFVGESTHKKNIFHLLPNHLLDLNLKKSQRFFPVKRIESNPLEYVSKRVSKMLKGYIVSLANRSKLRMAVTGGYDSRVLFLASLDVDCTYYVSKHHNMGHDHHDVVIPCKLTALYKKDFVVKEDQPINDNEYVQVNDIDFPRGLKLKMQREEVMVINGNISEVARNYFGYYKNATAKDLCYLVGYSTLKFPVVQYQKWLQSKALFEDMGYHYLDMFYWEEKMGNWTAKAKTEYSAYGKNITSPFNSRALLMLLLSTKRKFRDSHFNVLYDMIISELSDGNTVVTEMPVNPSKKQDRIRMMKKMKLYNLYRQLVLAAKVFGN